MNNPKKGSILLVNLDPIIGSEIGKKRPAAVVSNNINNERAQTITIVPITSSVNKIYPFEVFLPSGSGNLQTNSKAKANQIRTIDKKRIVSEIGILNENLIKDIENALLIHLDIRSLLWILLMSGFPPLNRTKAGK